MIQNIIVSKSGSESDDAAKTLFSSDTQWEVGGENLLVYKNGSLLQKGLHYSVLSLNQIQLATAMTNSDEITFCITKIKALLLDNTALDRVVKKVEGKTQTSLDKNVWEETIPSSFNIHSNEVWASNISESPAIAVNDGVALFYSISLVEDITVADKKGWYASSNGLISGRMNGWIPPKYGQTYAIRLYDALDVEIPSSSPINWKWDYSSGYLFIEQSHTYQTPFKITGYIYTGEYIGLTQGSGSFWKPPMPTRLNLPTIGNVNGDIRLVLDENILYRWDAINNKWEKTTYGSQSFKDPVGTFISLPTTGNTSGDMRLVLDENGIYRWNASFSLWVPVITNHEHTNYYTKTEVDSAMAQKSNRMHTHNTIYYQKTEVDALVRWRPPVATEALLPPYTENLDGDIILTLDSKTIWRFDYFGSPQGKWVPIVGAQMFWSTPVDTKTDLPPYGSAVGETRLVKDESNPYWWNGTEWQQITSYKEHDHDDLYPRKNEIRWKLPVPSFDFLPTTDNNVGDVRITLSNNNIYRWSGLEWILISASPLWREPVNLLIQLPTVGNIDGDCRVVKEDSCLYQWSAAQTRWLPVFNPDHNHDTRYYTKEELDSGQLDSRYYNESEIDSIVFNHTHDGVSSEKISYENIENIPYLHWKTPVVSITNLPTSNNTIGDARIVLNDADLYMWNGIAWRNVTGGEVAPHDHDGRYYTELEIDGIINNLLLNIASQLALKADLEHQHDARYYTKSETEAEIQERFDVVLGHDHDGSNSKRISYYNLIDIPPADSHDHDDRYYTKENMQLEGQSQVNWENVINKPDLANPHWKPPVQTKDDLPLSGNTIYDIRLVLEDSDIYEWNGVEWVWIGHWENRYVDYWKPPVESYTELPVLNNVNGDIRLVLDENVLYRWNSEFNEWIVVFSTTYNLQVYLNGDLLMENVEYVRIKEKSIKLLFDVMGGNTLSIVIVGETFIRVDFTTYAGQKLFEINNRYKRYDWQANAGHTIFVMQNTYVIGSKQLLVWLNGDLLKAGDDFIERSPTSFQLLYPLNALDRVTAVILDQKSGDGEYVREDQIATAGQTTFNLTNFYPMGSKRLLVYYNGLLLKSVSDYTEDTNASITLLYRTCNQGDHLTFIIFGSTSGLGVVTGAEILLGISTDGTYQDGLLDLNPEMKMNDAIDDINVALMSLAPQAADSLSNQILTTEGLSLYSGYVSDENVNYEISAGVYHNYLTENHDFYIFTPDNSFSDADKGILFLYVNGIVIDQFNLGNAFVPANADTYQTATSYGLQSMGAKQNTGIQGSNGAIRNSNNGFISIMSIEKHNDFKMWQKGKVRINVTMSILRQGYNYISLTHETPDGLQVTTPLKFFYDNANSRPELDDGVFFTQQDLISEKYTSGVRYYSIGDSFSVSLSAYKMFLNTYSQIPLIMDLPGIETMEIAHNDPGISGPLNPPRRGDFMDYDGILTLDAYNEYSINAKLNIKSFGPFGPGEELNVGNNNMLIDTYINSSTDLIEYFQDEVYRLPINNYASIPSTRTSGWNSSLPLTQGNAIVYNQRLQYASINYSNGYRPVQSVNYSSFTGPQQYIRSFYKRVPKNGGQLIIIGPTLQEVLTESVKVEVKLPGQTGWLSLNKPYDISTFTGIDGDGCLLSFTENGEYTYSSGTFSTANSGYMVLVRITLEQTSPAVTYLEMRGW